MIRRVDGRTDRHREGRRDAQKDRQGRTIGKNGMRGRTDAQTDREKGGLLGGHGGIHLKTQSAGALGAENKSRVSFFL